MAPNPHVLQRLVGIQKALLAAHESGQGMSAASKGREREQVLDTYLRQVMPAPFRFSDGDITDRAGEHTGQLDVVVEYPFLPSLPVVGGTSTRLFLAESVAAVIEIKSDIAKQWDEVEGTSKKVRALNRDLSMAGITIDTGMGGPNPKIPIFAIGFTGWATLEPLKERVDSGAVDGVLVLEGGLYCGAKGSWARGAWALWWLIDQVHAAASSVKVSAARAIPYGLA